VEGVSLVVTDKVNSCYQYECAQRGL